MYSYGTSNGENNAQLAKMSAEADAQRWLMVSVLMVVENALNAYAESNPASEQDIASISRSVSVSAMQGMQVDKVATGKGGSVTYVRMRIGISQVKQMMRDQTEEVLKAFNKEFAEADKVFADIDAEIDVALTELDEE